MGQKKVFYDNTEAHICHGELGFLKDMGAARVDTHVTMGIHSMSHLFRLPRKILSVTTSFRTIVGTSLANSLVGLVSLIEGSI